MDWASGDSLAATGDSFLDAGELPATQTPPDFGIVIAANNSQASTSQGSASTADKF
jgi:hypothetical protein